MDTNELKVQIAGIDEAINVLPRGSISTKKVNGHLYYYFCTSSKSIEIAIPQLRRPLGRLLLIGDIADRFELII